MNPVLPTTCAETVSKSAVGHFGGVVDRVRYDFKPAVSACSEHTIAPRPNGWSLRSRHGFDSFFCRPGPNGAPEKGGVEGEIGRVRRRHLLPVPNIASLAAINELLAAGDLLDDGRVITGRPVTMEAAFTAEAPFLMPLPAEPLDAAGPQDT